MDCFDHIAFYCDAKGRRHECFITARKVVYGNVYFTVLLSDGRIREAPASKIWRILKPVAKMFKSR